MLLFFLWFTIHQFWPAVGLWFLFLRVLGGGGAGVYAKFLVFPLHLGSRRLPCWLRLAHWSGTLPARGSRESGKTCAVGEEARQTCSTGPGLIHEVPPCISSSSAFLHSCVKCCLECVVYTSVFSLLETLLPIPAVTPCCAHRHHST